MTSYVNDDDVLSRQDEDNVPACKGQSDDSYVRFTIQENVSIIVDDNSWNEIFGKPENMRTYNWPEFVADLLAEHLPNCCIHFKMRKLYPHSSKYIAKYCFC